MTYLSDMLQRDFNSRKSKNYSYSLRSHALFLGVSPAQLSQLISGKRTLTMKMARKLSEKLELAPLEKEKLYLSTLEVEQPETDTKVQLADDEFSLIADWYHFAVLSLIEIKHTKMNALWISKRLGISHGTAQEALNRLERLKIIEIKNGKITQIRKNLKTTTDIPSAAIRKYHRQNLDLASEKLAKVPPEEREFTAITMPINPEKLPEAKKALTEFKRKLCDLLQEGDQSEVYTFTAQLFPVSIKDKK